MKAITYHYVRNSKKDMPYFRYLRTQNFIKQLEYFKQKYDFVSYNDFVSFIEGKSSFEKIKNKILLTFDDGLIDHYENVFPELKKRDLFGIFYIPTGIYQKQKALDVHRIHHLIGKIGGEKLLEFTQEKLQNYMVDKRELDRFKNNIYNNQENDPYTQKFKAFFNYYIKYEYRETLLDELVKEFSDDSYIFNNLYMTPEQLKVMQQSNMIIGSHSVNHLVLSKLSNDECIKEIHDSFNFLQTELKETKIKTFCYPYGGLETFNKQIEDILNNCNCQFSFSTQADYITQTHFQNRPQALPRYDCNQFVYGKASLG